MMEGTALKKESEVPNWTINAKQKDVTKRERKQLGLSGNMTFKWKSQLLRSQVQFLMKNHRNNKLRNSLDFLNKNLNRLINRAIDSSNPTGYAIQKVRQQFSLKYLNSCRNKITPSREKHQEAVRELVTEKGCIFCDFSMREKFEKRVPRERN